MKMFSKFLLSSGILMLAFSMMELNGQNFTVKKLPGVQECIQKEIPQMVKSHQATYAGTTYDTIQHSNSYNLIPWDNPEMNFSPSGASQYAGDINGDGYDDIIKTYTKIADDRTEDLSDYVNKTLLTYGGETVTENAEVLYTQIIPVGDINGDGFDDALGKNYDDTWQYYFGSAVGYVADNDVYVTNLPSKVLGFVDLDQDGYIDFINWDEYYYYKITFGASSVNNFETITYQTGSIGDGPCSQNIIRVAGKINNANDKLLSIYDDIDGNMYCTIDSVTPQRQVVEIERFVFPELFDMKCNMNYYLVYLVDLNNDGFNEIVWTISYGGYPTYALTDTTSSDLYARTPITLDTDAIFPIGDMNNDGRHDFFVKRIYSGTPMIGFILGDLSAGLSKISYLNTTNVDDFYFSYRKNISGNFGDMNHDGYSEISLETWNSTHSGERIYWGNPTGYYSYTDIIFNPSDYGKRSFFQTVNIGDFNGDGNEDIALLNEQKIWIFFGEIDMDHPDMEFTVGGEYLKFLKISRGNFNGDTFEDLAIFFSGGENYETAKVNVFFGSSEPDNVVDHTIDIKAILNFNYPFISGIDNIGDINNDGFDELLVFSNNSTGIFYGKTTLSVAPDIIMDSKDQNYGGRSIPLGDINGDGVNDFAISVYMTKNEIHVYFGKEVPVTESVTYEPDLILPSDTSGNKEYLDFGFGLTTGDYNGDGFNDIAALAYRTHIGNEDLEPLMHIYYGGMDMDTIYDALLTIPTSFLIRPGISTDNHRCADEFFTLPDLDGDGTNELYYSGRGWLLTNGFLLYGGDYLVPDSMPVKILIAPNQSEGMGAKNVYFYSGRNSAVGDFDGDGSIELITIQEDDKNYKGTPIYVYKLNEDTLVTHTPSNNIVETQHIRVYPNPADQYVFVELGAEKNDKAFVQICNLQGQIVMQEMVQKGLTRIDISELSKGMYIIKVETGGVVRVNKLIVK